MKTSFLNLTKLAIISLVSITVLTAIPSMGFAQDRMDDDCAIGLSVVVAPTEVKSWNTPVKISTTLRRDRAWGFYCSTRDVATFVIQYRLSNTGMDTVLRKGDLTIEPNQTGVGSPSTVTDEASFDFSKLGAGSGTSYIIVGASAGLVRHSGYKQTTKELVSQPVTIKLNPNTTVPQGTGTNPGETPPINPNETTSGKSTTGTTQGGTTTGTSSPKDPNTNVGIRLDTSFDTVLGKFFNPLEDDRPEQIIVRVINILLSLVAVLAVIFIILGGLMMVTSAGNQTRLQSGKQTLLYAVLGLILTLLSFSIVAIIQTIIAR